MIKGTKTSEKEYRAIEIDSSSSLKEFSKDRKKYYRKYILREKVEEDENQAVLMGKLVETKLMEPELFDEKFYPSICQSAPTGLMLAFVESLYRNTVASIKDGVQQKSMEELTKAAYEESGFKIKYEAVMGKFCGSEAETYFDEIMLVRTKGLTVITIQDITNCERIIEQLQNDPFVGPIVNQGRTHEIDVETQTQITGAEINDLLVKGMTDKIIVNHTNKTIQVYDLKCTWAVENFVKDYYLYRRAYIQGYVYNKLMYHHYADLLSKGYTVLPPAFIVCDSTGYFAPLIYTMSQEDLQDAYNGFTHKDVYYPGVYEIIEDLKWAKDNDVWNISKENYVNCGIVKIKK